MPGPTVLGARGTTSPSLDARGRERLYRDYRGLVADAVAWKLSGFPKEEVEEVVSSLWLKLFADDGARLRSYRGARGAAFATWLVSVAKNAAVDYLRRARVYSARFAEFSGEQGERGLAELLPDRCHEPLEELVARETRKELLRAVRRLPKSLRGVLVARYYRGDTIAETAAAYGVSENAVYIRLARAFARLRKELGSARIRGPAARTAGRARLAPLHRHARISALFALLLDLVLSANLYRKGNRRRRVYKGDEILSRRVGEAGAGPAHPRAGRRPGGDHGPRGFVAASLSARGTA